MIATQEEMVEARVPLPYRDQCGHLLNKCRQAEFYLPWKCENERYSYEKWEYELVMERILQMQKIRKEERAKSKQPLSQAPFPSSPDPPMPDSVPVLFLSMNERILEAKAKGYKEAFSELTRLGSTPPRCEHKCGDCIACYPIQIPTNKDLLGVQYANYEPEGWNGKCANSYFNP